MRSNFIYGIIWRANLLRIVLASLGLIAIVLAMSAARNPYINLLTGPFEKTPQDILNITDLKEVQEYYVTITGEEALDTGYYYSSKLWGIFETTYDSFIGLVLEDRLLLVRVSGDPTETITYTGALRTISPEIQREVLDDLEREYPELSGIFLPFLLDTSSFVVDVGLPLAAGSIAALAALGLLLYTLLGMNDGKNHPIMRSLAPYGDPEQVAEDIAQELELEHLILSKHTHLTRRWLIHRTSTSLAATRIIDIAWMYTGVTQHRTNGIPTGKTFKAFIYDRHGKKIEINGKKEAHVIEIIEAVAKRAPWAIMGYTKDIERVWNKDRAQILAAVDERKQELKAQRESGQPV